MNYFNVPYAPGTLQAVAYRAGREVARTSVQTTGAATRVELVPDRASLAGDGRDAMPVTVRALDAQGRAVPGDNSQITFVVKGEGKSIGHGNGDPNSHEDEKGPTRHLFNGMAQLIVQSNDDSSGDLVIEASAPGLAPARLVLPVRQVAPVPFQQVSDAPFTVVSYWRISPASATRPDPSQTLADFDMNTWESGEPPMLRQVDATGSAAVTGPFRIFRASSTPRAQLAEGLGTLHFTGITGRAEIWLDGRLLGKKVDYASGALRVALPAGQGSRQLSVLVEGQTGQAAGVQGRVMVEPAQDAR